MSNNIMYAIRNNKTGEFLPGQRNSSQYTMAATNRKPSLTEPPRMFSKVQYAKSCLKHWLAGSMISGYHDDGGRYEYIESDPTRISTDWDVVEMSLFVRRIIPTSTPK